MRHLYVLFFAFVSLVVAAVNANAQDGVRTPFTAGEKLDYEAKISRLKLSVAVADLSFAAEAGPAASQMLVTARAESKGTLVKLFRFSFLQEINSIVDFGAARVLKTTKQDVQKKRVRDSVAAFDYVDKRVSYTETDPNDPRRPPRRIASAIGDEMHDIITGIYSLRLRPMKVGATFEIPVSDSGLVYKIPVRVAARVQQKTVLGKVWCWQVEPMVFGPGRMIEQKGNMVLWITDDDRRVPVRVELDTTYGNIDIRLKKATFGPTRPQI